MTIRIDAKELQLILDHTPSHQNIMLVGKHGIGKSQILMEYYQEKGMRVIPFFLGQMSDPGDLIGLLNKDPKTGKSEFMPPYWWPMDEKPIVLFLDELNRARPELLQSVQDLALNRTLVGKALPEGSVIVSAVNEGEEYQITELDPALLSRFNIYQFVPSTEDWVVWAHKQELDSRVIQFLEKNPSFLDPEYQETDYEVLQKVPDRRAWVRVSEVIHPFVQVDASLIKLLAGIVGVSAAMNFKQFLKAFQSLSPEMVLLTWSKAKKSLDSLPLQDVIALNTSLLSWIDQQGKKLTATKQKKVHTSIEKYIEYLKESDRNEAIADLFNHLEKGNFEYATAFVMESVRVMELFTSYVEKVEL